MEILQWFLFVLLSTIGVGTSLVHGQDQSGFISIDCGGKESSTDSRTTIQYIPDAPFIDSGETSYISAEFRASVAEMPQLQKLRSFPKGNRNCYKVGVDRGVRYLIRAAFMYGNYDGEGKPPQFDLHIGTNKWVTIQIDSATFVFTIEIIHVAAKNHEYVCLADTGSGRPFISALEFRPLSNKSYIPETELQSLALKGRYDVASATNEMIRYPTDVHDRIWVPYHFPTYKEISTMQTISMSNNYHLPSAVMRTAATPSDTNEQLKFQIGPASISSQFYVYMHFSELVELQPNQTRGFSIYLNGEQWYGPIYPGYLGSTTVFNRRAFTGGKYQFSFYKVQGSTLPPYVNGIEVYYVVDLQQPQSAQEDIDAIMNIKSTYGIKGNWQGDPCSPQDYSWEGIVCNYNDYDIPRIISLNLTSNGLTGGISAYVFDLNLLQSLDLSNNGLTGAVPDFLSQMKYLKILNLSGNKLTGSVPPGLIERTSSGFIQLSLSGNPNLCLSPPCKKEIKFVVPLAASIAALFVTATALATLFWCLRAQKQQGKEDKTSELLDSKKRQFTFNEVKDITNNFGRVLGKGGFGTVYDGFIDDSRVAVKMISPSSLQGYKQFEAEVQILLRVYHGNLTTLLGFCDEGTNLALIYEYMANGDLQEHLSDGLLSISAKFYLSFGSSHRLITGKGSALRQRQALSTMKHHMSKNSASKNLLMFGPLLYGSLYTERNPNVMNWKRRLQISLDAAKGLEYLHHGCKPPIVHRDVKAANILLNDKFQAKLSDFGLSRMFPAESDESHVSTMVVGTPGYLDPEYYENNWLTEKSGVYSFGVVLLNIITGKAETAKSNERSRLRQWVDSLLESGDIRAIVDPILAGGFDINSAWRTVEIAMACMSLTSAERPTMNQVVAELSECLAIELAVNNGPSITIADGSIPLAR